MTIDWNNNLINLRDVLAGLYFFKESSVPVVQAAGLNVAQINFQNTARENWHYILNYARLADPASIDRITDIAIGQFPNQKGALSAAKLGMLTDVRGKDIEKDVQWHIPPADTGQLEKITGKQNTLKAITFLELGLLKSRPVARVDRPGGTGSGFLVRGLDKNGAEADILITNNHVLENTEQAASAKVQFNYQTTLGGLAATPDEYAADPAGQWATSEEDDWSAVLVKPNAASKQASETWGVLPLARQNPMKEDFTIIIQHPMGRPKEIALFHNLIAYVGNRVVQYWTDTEPGSSGSPVFSEDWNVIALHHSGGQLREPTGDPKQTFFRNEGIHINTVIDGLAAKGIIRL